MEVWGGNLFFLTLSLSISKETNHIDWQLPKICIQLARESENNFIDKRDDIFEDIWDDIFEGM